MAAVIAVLGLLPSVILPIAAGVPITGQTLGVMLAGIVLGPRHGALAVMLFLLVVLLGAPLLSGGRGGVLNVIIGTLLIGTMLSGMTIMDISCSGQNLIKGMVLLVAVVVDSF